MDRLDIFLGRMHGIGVDVEVFYNFPWIYLDRVCREKVEETYFSDHYYTLGFLPIREGDEMQFTDLTKLFNVIRNHINK